MANWFIDPTPNRARPSVRLRRLLPDANILGGQDWDVTGCTDDPTKVEPGHVFVAVRGDSIDRQASVGRALDRGAAGVVVEEASEEAGRRQAVVPNARVAYATLCHALAGDPAHKLDLIAIAGGSDAATIRVFLRSILDVAGQRFGVVTSSDWSDGLTNLPIGSAFPGADDLARMLNGMVHHHCVGTLVEVRADQIEGSSLIEGVSIAAAVVPSVREASDESLDVLEARRRAYARLIRRIRPGGVVVVNEDDREAEILGAVNLNVERVSIGIERPADVRGIIELVDARRSRFQIWTNDFVVNVALGLGGIETIRLAPAAFAIAWKRGLDVTTIVAGLEAVDRIPDQFERVEEGQGFETRVDPASTPETISKAIDDLRSVVTGRLYCVIGSQGNADRESRQRMAAVVESRTDGLVFTSDNPRGEDPGRILEDLLAGVRRPNEARVEPDRRRAIELALSMAQPGDAVLIAGKGRHAFQILADRVIPFDDRAVAARWLRATKRNVVTQRESA